MDIALQHNVERQQTTLLLLSVTTACEICPGLSRSLTVSVFTRKLAASENRRLDGDCCECLGAAEDERAVFDCASQGLASRHYLAFSLGNCILLTKGQGAGEALCVQIAWRGWLIFLCRCNTYLQLNSHAICKNLVFCNS